MVNSGTSLLYEIQPLEDLRWGRFLKEHPRSSIFHTTSWLEALRRTYAYNPIVFTTSPPGMPLHNGILFCNVDSWLTGRRWVSLPFSDHCEPLVDDAADMQVISSSVEQAAKRNKLLYVEFRPIQPFAMTSSFFQSRHAYCLHQLDLRPDLDTLFRHFHKDSTQRKIRRAEREGLTYEKGRSESLMNHFYRLLLLTRKRHQLPPQPKRWFNNLIASFGDALTIRVAFSAGQAVASMLTLQYKDTVVYKYGGSDAHFHNLGGVHLLFWNAIQEAKSEGLSVFDFGRSDYDNAGLLTFKDRWGSTRMDLTYTRFAPTISRQATYDPVGGSWKERAAKRFLSHLPNPVLSSIGNALYKHIG